MDGKINLNQIAKHFSDEETARELFEKLRWKNGVKCPHCENIGAYKIEANSTKGRKARKGLWKSKVANNNSRLRSERFFKVPEYCLINGCWQFI